MNNNWDTELPPKLVKKLNILLEQRSQLIQNDLDVPNQPIIKRHQDAVLRKSQGFQNSVEKLLDKEKCCLLNIMDDDLARRASPALRVNRNLSSSQLSSISFSDSYNNKLDKTFRSLSTAYTQHTGQASSPQPSNYNSLQAKGKHNEDSNELLLQLSLRVNEQQQEIQILKKQNQYCDCQDLGGMKEKIQEKLSKQKELYERLLLEKGKENEDDQTWDRLSKENALLQSQLKDLKCSKHQQELQMNVFKDNLIGKLNSYAVKLDQFNEREQKYLKIERENVVLKNEKEELQIMLFNLRRTK